jgi:hypothetical protein
MKRCDVCDLASERFGAVCQHIVHGKYQTYTLAPRETPELPDTACTSCSEKYNHLGDVAEVWTTMQIHLACESCYADLLSRQLSSDSIDFERNYRLIKVDEYAQINGSRRELQDDRIVTDGFVKLGFSPVPSTFPISLEKMWVRVVSRMGHVVTGILDNDPGVISHNILHSGSKITFGIEHVLEIFEEGPIPRGAMSL